MYSEKQSSFILDNFSSSYVTENITEFKEYKRILGIYYLNNYLSIFIFILFIFINKEEPKSSFSANILKIYTIEI